MKITVNKYLNARIGAPSVNAKILGYKSPGEIIDIDAVAIGDEIDGNAVWYHNSEDLCYYWSGGIDETEFALYGTSIGSDIKKAMLVLAEAKGFFWRKYREAMADLTGVAIEHDPLYQIIFQSVDPDSCNVPEIVHFKGFSIPTNIVMAPNSVFYSHLLGSSISRGGLQEWGSCGIKVCGTAADNAGNYILTNYHVAASDFLAQGIYSYSYGTDSEFRFCNMPSWDNDPDPANNIGWLYSGLFDEWHDVAMIRLKSEIDMTNTIFDGTVVNGHIDVFNDPDYKGKEVVLFGAKSGMRTGHIQSVNASQKFTLGAKSYYKDNLIQISNYSFHGDSGCPVLLDEKLIGLLIGSDTLSSYVLPIQRILNYFNLKL